MDIAVDVIINIKQDFASLRTGPLIISRFFKQDKKMKITVKIEDKLLKVTTYSYSEILNMGGLFKEIDPTGDELLTNRVICVIKGFGPSKVILIHRDEGILFPTGDWSKTNARFKRFGSKITIELQDS